MKCPACGMETPEAQGFCDFCKEPFRKKAPPPEPRKEEKVAVPPEVMAKLLALKAPSGPGAPSELPAEFASLDAGERIPELPAGARKAAWAFLGAVVLVSAVGVSYLVLKVRRAEGPAVPAGARVEGERVILPAVPPPPPQP